ncbi:MAG: family 16 glycoside hydrolase [Thermoguttaceae bacterium]
MKNFIILSALSLFLPVLTLAAEKTEPKWKPLFDGEVMTDWAVADAAGHGPVEVKDGSIVIGMGAAASGIKYKLDDFPKTNYEIRYEAKRGMGYDFFGALTFPVGESHCTFVNGGWGGGTIGLSCIDRYDASDNQTSGYYRFDKKSWYEFRVRVTDSKIYVWIKEIKTPEKIAAEKAAAEKAEKEGKKPEATGSDKFGYDPEKPVVDFVIGKHKISLRGESDTFKPLGFATWVTEGFIRKIEFRDLTAEEIEKSKKEADEYTKRFGDKL